MTLRERDIAAQDRIDTKYDPSEAHKPLMNSKSILLMNLGFFGVNYAMGLQQSAINPLFTIIGANPHDLPLLNLAGPMTGLLIQPVIGVLSDRTWTRWGRRKPFFVVGVVLAAITLFLFPFVSALWMAVVLLWLFGSHIIGTSAFGVDTSVEGFGETAAYQAAAGWTGLINGWYAGVSIVAAIVMIPLAKRFGAKNVHAVALLLAGIGLAIFPFVQDRFLMFIPMIGLGIAWASVCSLPFVMVTSMVPAARIGVYLGILNMMIVVPQLVETLSFGWIYENLLGADPTKACIFIGALFAAAGLAATWVNPPKANEESSLLPLGSPRRMTSAYNRVIVGSDGTPASLATVGHAAGIAAAAEARLVIVSAYEPGGSAGSASLYEGQDPMDVHVPLYGKAAAEAAAAASIAELTKDRFRQIERRIVEDSPARALLAVAGTDPTNLIVVGNRGMGAKEGHVLGSIPRKVVKGAVCDVMIVQTGVAQRDTGLVQVVSSER